MRRRSWSVAVALVSAATPATPAFAGSIRDDRADSSYTQYSRAPQYQAVGGVTYTFGLALGSGTLVSPRWVLTAGHVVDSAGTRTFKYGGITLEQSTNVSGVQNIPHPQWSRQAIVAGYDIGLFKLASPVTAIEPASRYTRSDEVGREGSSIGFGLYGTGSNPGQQLDGRKRGGTNIIDLLGAAAYPGTGASDNILAVDFDDPNNADGMNAFGSALPTQLEYCVASGDSGGGMFIDRDGRHFVAGVHSFVDAPDPPNGDATDDSSYSDTYGSTRVSVFNAWIDDQITHKWTNASGGTFGTAGNWTPAVPDQYDIAGLNTAGTYTINFAAAATNHRLIARAGTVTMNLGGNSYTLTSSTYEGSVIVGRYSGNNAQLGVANGMFNTMETVLAEQPGSSGLLVIGIGGTWNCGGDVYVGGNCLGAGGSGILQFNNGSATAISGTLNVRAASAVLFNGGTFNAGGIKLSGGGDIFLSAGGGKVVKTGTIEIETSATSQLDLKNGKLIASAASVGSWTGSTYDGVTGLVRSGFDGGAWNGGGIITSQSSARTSVLTTLAVANASDVLAIASGATGTWFGQTVSGSSVLVMYTWGGDADLNGELNGDDYFRLDSHILQSGSVFGYFNGDFNFDGQLNGDDYFVLDSNILYAQSAGGMPGLAAVPEPTLMGIALPLLAMLRRRR